MSGETVTSVTGDRATLSVARWIARRLIAGLSTGIVFVTVCAQLSEFRWFDEVRGSLRNTWFVEMNMRVHWGRVFLTACALGLFVPAIRIPETARRVLIAGLAGMPLALVTFAVLDGVLARVAVNRAFAGAESIDSELPVWLQRPRPNQKTWPGYYNDRLLWFSTPIVGLIAGLQCGGAWTTSGRARRSLLTGGLITFAVWSVVLATMLQVRFESYVDHVHARMEQHQLNHN